MTGSCNLKPENSNICIKKNEEILQAISNSPGKNKEKPIDTVPQIIEKNS